MTLKSADTMITAKAVIPVVPRQSILEQHAIIIKDEKIIDILAIDDATESYAVAHRIDLPEHVITPGFINLHGHAAMSLFRGLADDLPLMEWLNNHIWPAEGQWVNYEFVYEGSQLAIAEMLKGGTTFYSDMYFFPEAGIKAASETGIKAQFCCPILDFPTAWGSGPEDYLNKTKSLAQQYQADHDIYICIGPHAPYTVSDDAFKQTLDLANELELNVQVHLHETAQEVEDSVKATNKRPTERLNELGLFSLGNRLQCVHMTTLNSEDIDLLAETGAHVIHCPESNLKLASGFCPVGELVAKGINVAIGTDGAASNNDLDILGELRTASLLAKGVAKNASTFDAYTALEAITISAAKALNLENEIGSIEVGKYADLIAIDCDQLTTSPSYNVVSNIVYSASSTQVTHSWINGKLVMSDRELLTIDEPSVIGNAKTWSAKIKNAS